MNVAQCFEGTDDFLPARSIKLVGKIAFEGAQDLHFGNLQSVSEHERHLRMISVKYFTDRGKLVFTGIFCRESSWL